MIMESSGGIPRTYYNPDEVNVPIQVFSYGASYQAARARACAIRALLHGRGFNLTALNSGDASFVVNASEAQQDPSFLGIGTNGVFQFTANYILRASEA